MIFQRIPSFGRIGTYRLRRPSQDGDIKRALALGDERCHQAVHLVGLVLLQAAQVQHDGHAAGDVQHGGFAADEVVVKQEVVRNACIDSLQCVSPDL